MTPEEHCEKCGQDLNGERETGVWCAGENAPKHAAGAEECKVDKLDCCSEEHQYLCNDETECCNKEDSCVDEGK